MKPTVIVYGNCQAGVFCDALGWFESIRRRFDLCYVLSFDHPTEPQQPLSQDVLGNCRLLLQQSEANNSMPAWLTAGLPKGIEIIRFPPLDFNLLWPLNFQDPRNVPEPPGYPFGQFPYGDRVVVELLRNGLTADNLWKAYQEKAPLRIPDLDRLRRIEFGRLVARDRLVDVKFADLVIDNYIEHSMFWTLNHPTGRLLGLAFSRLVQHVFEALKLTGDPAAVALNGFQHFEPFGDVHVPIHPEIGRKLGLTWWTPTRTYRHVDGSFLTFEEYMQRYIRFCPNNQRAASHGATELNEGADFDHLYRLSKYCWDTARDLQGHLPPSREGQAALAEFIKARLAEADFDISISKSFVSNTIGCQDHNLVNGWTASLNDLAWLMVSESLSDFFVRFALRRWMPDLYLIHHIPKSGGTSVNEALAEASLFVAYPQTAFEAMVFSFGLMGFARQMAEFERKAHSRRIYMGGHFNLAQMVAKLNHFGDYKGVTLTRRPSDLLSSAVRYVWMLIERGDPTLAPNYAALNPATLQQLRQRLASDPDKRCRTEFQKVLRSIVEEPQFQAEYGEILPKYYYDDRITDPAALRRLLHGCGDIFVSLDIGRDKAAVLNHLAIDGDLPRKNVSDMSHTDLVSALGGDAGFRRFCAPYLIASSEIYGALAAIRSEYDEAHAVADETRGT